MSTAVTVRHPKARRRSPARPNRARGRRHRAPAVTKLLERGERRGRVVGCARTERPSRVEEYSRVTSGGRCGLRGGTVRATSTKSDRDLGRRMGRADVQVGLLVDVDWRARPCGGRPVRVGDVGGELYAAVPRASFLRPPRTALGQSASAAGSASSPATTTRTTGMDDDGTVAAARLERRSGPRLRWKRSGLLP